MIKLKQGKMSCNISQRKYRIEADTRVRLQELELQDRQKVGSSDQVDKKVRGGNGVNVTVITNAVDPLSVPVLNDLSLSSFNVAKNIVLVPAFLEKGVEAYFQAFERLATALKWLSDVWSLMLQCKFAGRAQELCASLSLEESVNYETLKIAVLRAYEFVHKFVSKTITENHMEI